MYKLYIKIQNIPVKSKNKKQWILAHNSFSVNQYINNIFDILIVETLLLKNLVDYNVQHFKMYCFAVF